VFTKNKYRSLYYSLVAVFFLSTVASTFKVTLEGLTNAQILFYASLTSTVVLGVITHFNEGNLYKIIFGRDLLKNLLMGLFNPFVYYLILIEAYDILPAQEAMVINYSWPILLSIFFSYFFKSKNCCKIFVGFNSFFFRRNNLTNKKLRQSRCNFVFHFIKII
jgi:drug/metabolite transporter (DMT)-like permease